MFDVFGIALWLNVTINVITEQDKHVLGLRDTSLGEINILFLQSTCEYCCLVEAKEFGKNCAEHNPYCEAVLSQEFITCKDCRLSYHVFCAGKPDSCGCSGLTQLATR